jgi:precorrin-2 dehydrogenase
MKYYPVNLDINNRACLVVGGGQVGTRKALGLLDCGARVTVVSPEGTDELARMTAAGRLTWKKRGYAPDDLADVFLVIGATDNEVLNRRVHADAHQRNLLCNIADRPKICNFILPAVIRRGDLVLAVSTSGKSPAFAKTLRKSLEKQFGEEYDTFLQLMGAIRHRLLSQAHAPEAHKPLFEQLIDGGLVNLIRDGEKGKIDTLLRQTLGEGFAFDALMDITG